MSQDDFVKLENVAVTYGRDAAHAVTALDETSLRIGKGELLRHGRSGAVDLIEDLGVAVEVVSPRDDIIVELGKTVDGRHEHSLGWEPRTIRRRNAEDSRVLLSQLMRA